MKQNNIADERSFPFTMDSLPPASKSIQAISGERTVAMEIRKTASLLIMAMSLSSLMMRLTRATGSWVTPLALPEYDDDEVDPDEAALDFGFDLDAAGFFVTFPDGPAIAL